MSGFNFNTLVDDVVKAETEKRAALVASSTDFAVRVLVTKPVEWHETEWVTLPAVRGIEAAEAIEAVYKAQEMATDIVAA